MTHTVARPNVSVDVAVVLPQKYLMEKDWLNFRYHDKRTLYLAVIAQALQGTTEFSSHLQIDYFNGDLSKPMLVVHYTPSNAKSKKSKHKAFAINIIPALAPETFPVKKLDLVRNNNRLILPSGWSADQQPSTPHYNMSVLEDMYMFSSLEYIHAASSNCTHLKEGILLLKVWLRQRQFLQQSATLGTFHFSILAAHLVNVGLIKPQMTSFQIFRAVLSFITTRDLTREGVIVGASNKNSSGSGSSSSGQQVALFHAAFEVVIADPSGHLNYAHRVSGLSFRNLQREAKLTLQHITHATDTTGFVETFLTPVPFVAKYDHLLNVTLPAHGAGAQSPALVAGGAVAGAGTGGGHDTLPATIARQLVDTDLTSAMTTEATRVLRIAYSDRLASMSVFRPRPRCHSVTQAESKEQTVVFGLIWNPDTFKRRVDRGPPADDADKSEEWLRFWGDASDLRRFKDGSIVHTVVWENNGVFVAEQIAKYVLVRHLHLKTSHIHYMGNQLDELLIQPGHTPLPDTWQQVIKAFNELRTCIKGVDELPLAIANFFPVGTALRRTCVFAPQPHILAGEIEDSIPGLKPGNQSLYTDGIDVVMQFESSGRWPDDLHAIGIMKTAFFLTISEGLQQRYGINSIVSHDGCDILYHGYVFRVRIWHDRELTLAQRTSKELAISTRREYVLKPRHAGKIQALHGRIPGFGPAVRLAKLWLHRHMFSPHINDEMVELMMASVFHRTAPKVSPSASMPAFIRFLNLLGTHNWQADPLFVPLGGDSIPSALRSRAEADLANLRETKSHHHAMYIVTVDDEASAWTFDCPSKVVLTRMSQFAKAAEKQLISLLSSTPTRADWLAIFTTPMESYDVTITLDPNAIPHPEYAFLDDTLAQVSKPHRAKFTKLSKFKNLRADDVHSSLLVNFNPARDFVRHLTQRLEGSALVFYNELGGDKVGIIFRPAALMPVKAKPHTVTDRRPLDDRSGQVIFNMTALLQEIALFGQGVVINIESRKGGQESDDSDDSQ
eukprot:TRINITY_DN880_c0_g1_i2.p1 TRINITY_DN880_c0_g1~~TRINITY_DN880_c0_g1_i2.p1  ORF type:complete len:1010 (+),score=252.70 TRINITY_DN880_c0_g1_i2:211-3240(+)